MGGYTASASPNGRFDQGGNAYEWNEAIIESDRRGLRGGSLDTNPFGLAASVRIAYYPTIEALDDGFRVASILEPTPRLPAVSPTGVALLGGLVFAIALAGLAVERRLRAR